jgi:hypothetical protein
MSRCGFVRLVHGKPKRNWIVIFASAPIPTFASYRAERTGECREMNPACTRTVKRRFGNPAAFDEKATARAG